MPDSAHPQDFLPLRPIEFEILLVLTGGTAHGYAIIKEANERWPGASPLETGTLYRALRRLTKSGLVEPAERKSTEGGKDERRRYFAITPLGTRVASAEASRLADQLDVARARQLLRGAVGGS